ncbi:MAG: hypothetical protein WAR39_05725 [Prevotella sp.]
MNKLVIIMLLQVIFPVIGLAQKSMYHVIATVQRNMRTLDYGKVSPVDFDIVKTGNSSVTVKGKSYTVIKIDKEVKTDSIESIQFTAQDSEGQEYIIKFSHEPYSQVALMKFQMILFDVNHPYDWTYYFSQEPRKIE